MTFRFLIDECLSPVLVQIAREFGYWERTCVRDRGLSGTKDHELVRFAVANDFTIVTHNAVDFRGPVGGCPGGLHSKELIHAGLVCLESHFTMTRDRQEQLFRDALAELRAIPDLVNQALEVVEDSTGQVTIYIYRIPAA